MFSEILKIIPRVSESDLNKMEKNLNKRFGRIGKKFGSGLKLAVLGGGWLGIALGIVDKILNPLKETQEAIDKMLKNADDISTNAKQFGTTAGKLFKLQQVAASTGLDRESLDMLITKFQTAVAEAAADPQKKTSVRQFVGYNDTVEGFFSFIQGLQRLDKNKQLLVQQEVFGEKQVLKMADFLQTNFAEQLKFLRARPAEAYTPGLERLAAMNDMADVLESRRTMEDTLRKSETINAGMVTSRHRQLQTELERENQRIASYKALATISEASAKVLGLLETAMIKITEAVTQLVNISKILNSATSTKWWRGLFGGGN